MKRKILMRLFSGILTAALLFSVAGCGATGKAGSGKDTGVKTETEVESTVSETNDVAADKNDAKPQETKEPETTAPETETAETVSPADDVLSFWQDGESVDLSYKKNVLTVNGTDYKLDINEIMNAWQVGNFVVVESHINPHVGSYALFCLDTCQVEEIIIGANLIWMWDDISTAVYSSYNEIYNYRGNLIGVVEDGQEICALSFDEWNGYDPMGENRLIVSYWKENDDTMYTTFCEFENTNAALFAYENYLRRPTKERWDAFLAHAPEDAIAFIAEGGYLSDFIVTSAKGSPDADPYDYDQLLVVALEDNTECALRSGTWFWDDANEKEGFDFDAPFESDLSLKKGEGTIFKTVIPEGVPCTAIDVRTKTGDQGIWPISMISGYNDQACLFVTRQ